MAKAKKKPEVEVEEIKVLAPLVNLTAVGVYTDGDLPDLIKQVQEGARSLVPDLTTEEGRKAIASNAYNVAKSKTYLDTLGKDMVAVWKQQAKVVDSQRKEMRETFDDLRDEVRKPLTDWEEADDLRIEKITGIIQETVNAGNNAVEYYLSQDLQTMIDRREELVSIDPADFEEFEERMGEVRLAAMAKMETAIEKRKQHDLDQKELDELRAEKEERERKDAEEKADRERVAREEQIAKDAKADAEAREAKAVQDKKDAEARADQAVKDSKARAEKAEKDAKEATARAEQDARDKLAREQQAERDEQAKRERNTRHKAKINNEAVDAIVKASKVTPAEARKIVTAIARGKITNVQINY